MSKQSTLTWHWESEVVLGRPVSTVYDREYDHRGGYLLCESLETPGLWAMSVPQNSNVVFKAHGAAGLQALKQVAEALAAGSVSVEAWNGKAFA